MQEEIGLTLPIGRPLVVVWVPAHGVWPDGVMFVFDEGRLTREECAELRPTDDELVGVKLLSFKNAEPLLRPSMARRIDSAISALADGEPRYLEFGRFQSSR